MNVHTEAMAISTLEKLHQDSITAARKQFDMGIEELNAAWLKSEQEYLANIALAEQIATTKYRDYRELNDKRIRTKCEQRARHVVDDFDSQQKDFTPFPDEEPKLEAKSHALGTKLIASFEEGLQEFINHQIYQEVKNSLEKQLATIHQEMLERNVKVIKATCFSVFKCAKKIVDDNSCTFCVSNFFPFAHRSTVGSAAHECFLKDPKANTISKSLKEKVIDDWYEVDLAADRSRVTSNITFLLASLILIAVSGGSIWFKLVIPSPNQKYFEVKKERFS